MATSNTAVATQQATQQATGLKAFNQTLTSDKMGTYLSQVLQERKNSFINNIVALVGSNTNLQKCNPLTVIYAGIKATALGLPLDPNLGQAYVIPYGTNAQFQVGYKGFIQLAIRSGQFKTLNTIEVKEGELEEFDLLSGELTFKAKPNRHTLATIGYVAFFELLNGFRKSLYMTLEEVLAHRNKFSKAHESYLKLKEKFDNGKLRDEPKASTWDTDFDAMAKKTVLKLLLNRYAPMSIEMQNAVTADQAVFKKDADSPEYVDNPFAGTEEASYEEVHEEDTPLAEVVENLKNLHTDDEVTAYAKSVKCSDRGFFEAVRHRKNEIAQELNAHANEVMADWGATPEEGAKPANHYDA